MTSFWDRWRDSRINRSRDALGERMQSIGNQKSKMSDQQRIAMIDRAVEFRLVEEKFLGLSPDTRKGGSCVLAIQGHSDDQPELFFTRLVETEFRKLMPREQAIKIMYLDMSLIWRTERSAEAIKELRKGIDKHINTRIKDQSGLPDSPAFFEFFLNSDDIETFPRKKTDSSSIDEDFFFEIISDIVNNPVANTSFSVFMLTMQGLSRKTAKGKDCRVQGLFNNHCQSLSNRYTPFSNVLFLGPTGEITQGDLNNWAPKVFNNMKLAEVSRRAPSLDRPQPLATVAQLLEGLLADYRSQWG